MKQTKMVSAIVATVATTITLAAPAIAEPITVGPGDPIRTPLPGSPVQDGKHMDAAMCSSSIPGTITDKDGKKHRVMLTAGHCVNSTQMDGGIPVMGDEVYAPTRERGDVKIGNRGPHNFGIAVDENETDPVKILNGTFNSSDWAFIELEDDVETTNVSYSKDEFGQNHGEGVPMTGIVDYKELGPGEVSVDNLGQPVCIDGSRTGRSCGYQIFRVRNGVWAIGPRMDHGDSGGNAYNPDTRQVVGMNSMVIGPLNRFQPADTAIEEAYGIEDGHVNDHFTPAESSADRSDEYRTISEDAAAMQEFKQKDQEPAFPGAELLPDIPGVPSIDEIGSQLPLSTSASVLNQGQIPVPTAPASQLLGLN